MQWKITTGSDRDAGNAQSYTGTEGRPVFVDVTHPGVGPDAVVEIIDVSTQRTLASVSCGFTDQGPKRVEFSPVADGARTYNLVISPIGAAFGDPGILISANDTSTPVEVPYVYTPSTQTTAFGGPVTAPSVNGQTYSSTTGITTMPGAVLASKVLAKNNPSQGARKRVIIEGDSISSSYPPGQWPHIATMQNNGMDYIIVWSDSVSGTNLEQMDTRIDAIPSTVIADEIWIQGGTNPDTSSQYGATTKNKNAIKSIASKCILRGWIPVFLVPPPLNSQVTALSDFGKWLIAWCAQNGYRCVNIWIDAIDTNGQLKAASTIDGTHPTTAASIAAAKRMNEFIRPGSSQAGFQPQFPLIETTNSSTINLATNPLCSTSSGGLATGWNSPSGAGTSTPSIVSAPAPMVGNLQNFVDSFAQGAYVMHRRAAINVTGGHRYLVIDYIRINSITDGAANGQMVNINLSATGNNSGQINWGAASKSGPSIVHVGSGFFIREITVPANDTTLQLGYYVQSYTNAGSGTINWDVGGHIIIDLTAADL